jgi:4-hydroxy-tetrahydrodipicolinate reductase
VGQEILRKATVTGRADPVLLVDPREELVGRFAGEFIGGIPVSVAEQPVVATLEEGWDYVEASPYKPTTAVVATGSRVAAIADTVLDAISRGLNVVSTCEELAFPWLRAPELAAELDRAAKAQGVSVLSTGVNPGFVMDMLPAVAARGVVNISSVSIERVVNASKRRGPLQRKIGAELSVAEFDNMAARGEVGHVGLGESACILCEALNIPWRGSLVEAVRPIIADRTIRTDHVRVEAGQVRGVEHSATVATESCVVRLMLRMALDEPEEYDHIEINGDPPVSLRVSPGFHGDVSTAAVVVNSIPLVEAAPSGLLSVLDLPVKLTRRS